MFNFLIRNEHVFRGKLKKDVFDSNTSIPSFRERCENGAKKFGKIPKEIDIKEQLIEGINSEWLIPKGSDPQKIILYVHGGRYVSGFCSDHRGIILQCRLLKDIH